MFTCVWCENMYVDACVCAQVSSTTPYFVWSQGLSLNPGLPSSDSLASLASHLTGRLLSPPPMDWDGRQLP